MIVDPNRDSDMVGSRKAIIRAARRAAEVAQQHNQPLLLWREGHVIEVFPKDLPVLPDEAPFEKG